MKEAWGREGKEGIFDGEMERGKRERERESEGLRELESRLAAQKNLARLTREVSGRSFI